MNNQIEKPVVEIKPICNIPPEGAWSRNQFGLLKNYNYEFNEDGSVNWRALIAPEFIVPNRQTFSKRGIDVSKLGKDEIAKLVTESEDKDLLILLAGYKNVGIRDFCICTMHY